MRKELMPGLFEEKGVQGSIEMAHAELASLELNSLNPIAETKRLEKRFDGLLQEMRLKHDELNKSVQSKFEQFLYKLSALDAKFEALNQDIRAKYSHLSGKVTERNLTDMKTQALVDRHTQLMRQFEQRVAQLQRVVEEQEYQILNYKAALDDARKELGRLKKL